MLLFGLGDSYCFHPIYRVPMFVRELPTQKLQTLRTLGTVIPTVYILVALTFR